MNRSAEDIAKRLDLRDRLLTAIAGEEAQLGLEALLDAVSVAVITLVDNVDDAARLLDVVGQSLPRRVGHNWEVVKRQQPLVRGVGSVQ